MDYKINKEVSTRLVLAFTCADKQDWHQFFEFLRQRQFEKIRSTLPTEDLIGIKHVITSLTNLEESVNQIITKKDLTNVI